MQFVCFQEAVFLIVLAFAGVSQRERERVREREWEPEGEGGTVKERAQRVKDTVG